TEDQLDMAESLHYEGSCRELGSARFSKSSDPKRAEELTDWYAWREQQGSVGRENKAFFDSVREILHHCKGVLIGDKLNTKNRIDSDNTLSQMTAEEQSFKLQVNHLLNKIQAPVYRQITVEALKAIASIFRDNQGLHIDDTLITDVIINHAVRISWLQWHPDSKDAYEESTPLAWQAFYRLPPHQVANAVLDALVHLLSIDPT
ncbi:MAG: glycosyl hydrolase family 15, partial [Methylococcaceae bacterium]|nr:glycosyl hydrolase family 15 [Methylococcaceae bacterium]